MNKNGPQRLNRSLVGVVLPLSFVILTILPFVLFRERLPESLAIHWGATGQPNGSMTFQFLVIFQLMFTAVPASVMAIVARRKPAYLGKIVPTIAFSSFVAASATIASWLFVAVNLDVTDWSQAGSVGVAQVGLILGIAGMVAMASTLLARSFQTSDALSLSEIPSVGLEPGARAVWVGSANCVWAFPIFLGFLAVGVFMVWNLRIAPGLLSVLVGLLALPFTSIRVIADRHGVRIHYGALGWPTKRIPLADIRQASATTVHPLERGGWGYRGSLRMFGRASVVLRGGEGIQLDLARDRVLTITVDDALEGAGLINDLVAAPAAS